MNILIFVELTPTMESFSTIAAASVSKVEMPAAYSG
jgi:hypothetical protein